MERRLTSLERKNLINRHRKERDGRTRDRIKAVLAYDDGYTYTDISHILLLDDETIRRHIEDYWGSKKIKPQNGGSESKLTQSEAEELIRHLKTNTYDYVKDICCYVEKEYHKKYSISGMTYWLHSHGFRYKKPHAVPAKADREKQEAFIKKYRELKRKTQGKEPIYFADSVHPQHQTHLSYGWIYKGVRKEIATTGRQYRLNLMGGICLDDHRIVYEQSDKVNADSIQLFLKKLRNAHPNQKKIHLIWDNTGYHRSRDVKNSAKKLAIELHYLPPYSPNLNPIERLWKIMHEQVSYNTYIGKKKKLLASRITDNFQILNSPLFAS